MRRRKKQRKSVDVIAGFNMIYKKMYRETYTLPGLGIATYTGKVRSEAIEQMWDEFKRTSPIMQIIDRSSYIPYRIERWSVVAGSVDR